MISVSISPKYKSSDRADGGIRRVVEAQLRYLPNFDIKVVEDPSKADIIACHAGFHLEHPGTPIVAHCHGLYWDRNRWPSSVLTYNQAVTEVLARSVAQTVPSQWVKTAVTRGMLINPKVIYHGVDADDWHPDPTTKPYVLWNKARADNVCDPREVEKIARTLPGVEFVSTFGNALPNLHLTGAMPYEEMKTRIQQAGLYLVTAQETFGIGTLEALASGVPIVGWDWGGQSEIVIQGETGYLAPPGDYGSLAECILKALEDRERLSRNARLDAETRWQWEPRIEEYAELYHQVYDEEYSKRPKVSIIVPCYKLAGYLNDCLLSVQNQTEEDFECLVVDDCSPDDTERIGKEWTFRDSRFSYIRTPENFGTPATARNYGFSKSHGKYILFLDADDQITPNTLELLSRGLDQDPGVHIAYGHLDLLTDDGKNRSRGQWPRRQFNWYEQISHLNQLPYCSMMKRRVMENSGGFRKRVWLTEDAEFWTRVTSFGYRAKKVTEESTLIYRMRPNSRIQTPPGEGDWTAWFPWRIAGSPGEAEQKREIISTEYHPHPDRVPFSAQGAPGRGMEIPIWPVHDFNSPTVSVVIPVGPRHRDSVVDTLDSLVSQTFQNWECIVVNDSGEPWTLTGYAWAKVIDTPGRTGPGNARNLGSDLARGQYIVFLDADDFLLPWALSDLLEAAKLHGEPALIYTDWLKSNGKREEPLEVLETPNFECSDVLERMRHAVTCLIPMKYHRMVRFDTSFQGWEDWDYFIQLQAAGLCSVRLAEPCFVYQMNLGTERENSLAQKPELLEVIKEKWKDYYSGVKTMACRGCRGRNTNIVLRSRSEPITASTREIAPGVEGVWLEYQGPGNGGQTFRGRATGNIYRIQRGQRKLFDAADVPYFLSLVRSGVPFFAVVDSLGAPPDRTVESSRFTTTPVAV